MNNKLCVLLVSVLTILLNNVCGQYLNHEGIIYINPNIYVGTENVLYANKDIPMGTVLFIEKPLIDYSFNSQPDAFIQNCQKHPFLKHLTPKVNISRYYFKNFIQPISGGIDKFQKARKVFNIIPHLSWDSFLYSSLLLIKFGFKANIDISKNYKNEIDDNPNIIVGVAVADIKENEQLIQPLSIMKHLLRTYNISQLKQFNLKNWMEKTKIHLTEHDKNTLMTLKTQLAEAANKTIDGICHGDLGHFLTSDVYHEIMEWIYKGNKGQEMYTEMNELVNVLFKRIAIGTDSDEMVVLMQDVIDNELYTFLNKDTELVKWFFNVAGNYKSQKDTNNLINHVNADGMYFWNSNIAWNVHTKQLQVTSDIKMGTMLLIEAPWIYSEDFPSFVTEWRNLPHNNSTFFSYFQSLLWNKVPYDTETPALFASLPDHLQFNGTCMQDLMMEYTLRKALNHLTNKFVFHSSLPLIRIGFHANVAIFEDPANSNVFAVSTCDLNAGENLIQPIDFLKQFKINQHFDLGLWRRKTEMHLNDNDKKMLNLLWNNFCNIHRWMQHVKHGDKHHLSMIQKTKDYHNVILASYQNVFAQEIIFGMKWISPTNRENWEKMKMLISYSSYEHLTHLITIIQQIQYMINVGSNEVRYLLTRFRNLAFETHETFAADIELFEWIKSSDVDCSSEFISDSRSDEQSEEPTAKRRRIPLKVVD
eukprot:515803_1